jgi:regulator of replication initiation timing
MGVKGDPNSTNTENPSQIPNPAQEQIESATKAATYSDAEIAARTANANASLRSGNPAIGNTVAESSTPSTSPRPDHAALGADNEHPVMAVIRGLFGLNRSAPATSDSQHKRNILQKIDRTSTRGEGHDDEVENTFSEVAKEFQKMESIIRGLDEENRGLKTNCRNVNTELNKLKVENSKLRDENTKIKTEKEAETKNVRNKLQKAKETSQNELKQKEDDFNAKLVRENDRLTSKFETEKGRLESEKNNLLLQLRQWEAQYNNLSISHNVLLKSSQRDIDIRDNEIKKCKADNQSLRGYIDNMRNAQEPIRGEEKYTQPFEDLNNNITSWAFKQSKRHANVALQDSKVRTAVLTKLESFGVHGKHTATCFRSSLLQLYYSKKTRAPLIRHILALFLFDRVFYPFAFALKSPDSASHDASHYITFIEDDLFEQG